MAENIREIVLDTLLVLEREKTFSHTLIKAVLDKYDYLDARDKAFLKRVTEGTIERKIEIDYYLNQFSKVPVHKMKPLIRNLLEMSVYQLLFMDAVPDSAVCNEACKLAAKRQFYNLKGFVNGVLRNISKSKEALQLPDGKKEPALYLSVKYSMPLWLVELWLREYNPEMTERILQGLLQIHPVSLRFSTKLSEEERRDLCDEIKACGGKLTQSKYLPYVYALENAEGIANLPGFAQGQFVVQDVSSALAVEMAGIKDTDFVIDVCAAPGGKSLLAAEKAKHVLSRDVSNAKVEIIEENLQRMGCTNVTTQVYDGRECDETLAGQADVVLLDVPCSGLGIMGKKRDIKYHLAPDALESLNELQRQIVRASAGLLKPGGTLLYSTCTIHKQENEDMAKWIEEELGFIPVSLAPDLPDALKKDMQGKDLASHMVQLLPGCTESDGFFFAKFRKA